MGYKVVVGKSAQLDLQNILEWYAGESIAVLQKFVDALYSRFQDLSERPESFGIVRQRPRFRKLKINRFPYYVIYRLDESRNVVFIATVIHEKRKPEVWIRRLRK